MRFDLMHPADQLVLMMNRIYYRGMTTTSGGNLSIKDENGVVWITPSGIDNTVIAYEQPVWFVKGQPPAPFAVHHPFTLVIANSGIPSPTRSTVGDVRQGWLASAGAAMPVRPRVLRGIAGSSSLAITAA